MSPVSARFAGIRYVPEECISQPNVLDGFPLSMPRVGQRDPFAIDPDRDRIIGAPETLLE
jgi:hypothetical protein